MEFPMYVDHPNTPTAPRPRATAHALAAVIDLAAQSFEGAVRLRIEAKTGALL
jgi:hypothetical protein